MTNGYHFKLIEGKFSPASAGEILFALISSKIQYHEMELFSNEERFAKDLANSKKRIGDLRQVSAVLKELITGAASNNQSLRINGYIEIQLEDE